MSGSILMRGGLRPDPFVHLADDATAPAPDTDILVSLERWQAESAALRARLGRVGVRIDNHVDVAPIAADLVRADLICLLFPGFADGRAYSQARLLRDRFGFRGQLRAAGAAVVRDQIVALHRCGFDAFDLREDQDPAACLAQLEALDLAYQPAQDALESVRRRRRRESVRLED
jgi:uncharacterized protein (DUF934 family)